MQPSGGTHYVFNFFFRIATAEPLNIVKIAKVKYALNHITSVPVCVNRLWVNIPKELLTKRSALVLMVVFSLCHSYSMAHFTRIFNAKAAIGCPTSRYHLVLSHHVHHAVAPFHHVRSVFAKLLPAFHHLSSAFHHLLVVVPPSALLHHATRVLHHVAELHH